MSGQLDDGDKNVADDEKRKRRKKDGDDTDDLDIVTSLKKFMETSSLGEYSSRLAMLHACHCHMLHIKAGERQTR